MIGREESEGANVMELYITNNTYEILAPNNCPNNCPNVFFDVCQVEGWISCDSNNEGHIITFLGEESNLENEYKMIKDIVENAASENNYWIESGKKYPITDVGMIKKFLRRVEDSDDCFLAKRYRLRDLIRDNKISSIRQLEQMSTMPFSGLFLFDEHDYKRLWGPYEQKMPSVIQSESYDIIICNRYIKNSFISNHGKVKFCNCVIEGDIEITDSSWVYFSQCIVTGSVSCHDVKSVYISSSNMKEPSIDNSKELSLHMEYSRVYSYCSTNNQVVNISMYKNEIFEPCIVSTRYPDSFKLDMSQFVKLKISKRIIRRITGKKRIIIKDERKFYLSFMFDSPVQPAESEDVALNMVTGLLEYGDLEKHHDLYADLKYKKSLYTNKGAKRLFVFLTGAFYKPSRWVIFLGVSTILFALIYSLFPGVEFLNTTLNSQARMGIWTALYYSIFQIIGTNPTEFNPAGITNIITTLQALLNTLFLGNLFASFTRKYIREDV